MDKFLDIPSLTKLNQDEINNLSRLIISDELEGIILKNLSNEKAQGQMGSEQSSTRLPKKN